MTIRMLSYRAVFATLLALTVSTQVGAQPAAPQAGGATLPAAADQGYVLGPQDVIEVDVLGQADFKVRAPIGADGSIELPFLGKVAAANKTTIQLSSDIEHALEAGGFYSHPILSVQIVAYSSRYVTVLGEVGTPGLVPIDKAYHLSEILARVGGMKEDAADYVIVR